MAFEPEAVIEIPASLVQQPEVDVDVAAVPPTPDAES
jgi:hypothetical protein